MTHNITFAVTILALILSSCSTKSESQLIEEYFNLTWSSNDGVLIENGGLHSPTHLDTINHELVGDTIYPIEVFDSTIVVRWLAAADYEAFPAGFDDLDLELGIIKDTMFIDTSSITFRNFHGPKLVLKKKGYEGNLFVEYILGTQEINSVTEFNNQPVIEFEIEGYTVGDSIDLGLLEYNEQEFDDDLGVTIKEYSLKSDSDIELSLIGGKYISAISRKNISDSQIEEIKAVVSEKTGSKPIEYSNDYSGYRATTIFWSKQRTSISLYSIDCSERYSLFESNPTWRLNYENSVMTEMLALSFQKEGPHSEVIR